MVLLMITFSGHSILQRGEGLDKIWTPAELLETNEPLPGEPLAVRTASLRRALAMAEAGYDRLSERAVLGYQFWKQLVPQRVEERTYEYTVDKQAAYRWKLTVNTEGLFYQDIDAMYSRVKGQVFEQLFSDFWFYGPKMPIPALVTRKWVVAQIRNAFMQIGPVAYQHFKLFEYPDLVLGKLGEDSDDTAPFFINLWPFGIEYGGTTGQGDPADLNYLSFEHFLTAPEVAKLPISSWTRSAILQQLSHSEPKRPDPGPEKSDAAEMKRMFMENGGRHASIYRDYGKSYRPNPLDEQRWRRELVEKYTEQLRHEDRDYVISYLASSLQYNGVPDVEDLLRRLAKEATPAARQAFRKVRKDLFAKG